MDIVYAVQSPAAGVARIRLTVDGLDGDVLAVAVDTAPWAWAAAGDVLLREDSRTARQARAAAEVALCRHPGATAAVAAHPHGYVISTRTRTSMVEAKPRGRERDCWSSRLRAVCGFACAGVTRFGVEGLSFGEMAGAFLLATAAQFDPAEGGEELSGVEGGIERSHRAQ